MPRTEAAWGEWHEIHVARLGRPEDLRFGRAPHPVTSRWHSRRRRGRISRAQLHLAHDALRGLDPARDSRPLSEHRDRGPRAGDRARRRGLGPEFETLRDDPAARDRDRSRPDHERRLARISMPCTGCAARSASPPTTRVTSTGRRVCAPRVTWTLCGSSSSEGAGGRRPSPSRARAARRCMTTRSLMCDIEERRLCPRPCSVCGTCVSCGRRSWKSRRAPAASPAATPPAGSRTPPWSWRRRASSPGCSPRSVRVISVVRTLVAVEEGAVGPDKDCGYEGPYLKAITGIPISMEGKTSACAHSSPVGNVAAACRRPVEQRVGAEHRSSSVASRRPSTWSSSSTMPVS